MYVDFNAHVMEVAPDRYFGPLQFLFICDYTTAYDLTLYIEYAICKHNTYTSIMLHV